MTRRKVCVLLFLILSLAVSGCHRGSRSERASARESQNWPSYVNEFLDAYFAARPDFAVRAGKHEFDGKLPDWSPDGIAKEIKRLKGERDRISKFRDSSLTEKQRFERDYLNAVVDADLFWLESVEWPFRCPQYYADGIDPDVYVSRNYAPLDQRIVAYTNYAKSVPAA